MALIDVLYDRVQEAKFEKKDHVEITHAEYGELRHYMTHRNDPPLPDGVGALWGFPAKIVD